MKCLPVNMTACLPTSANRNSLGGVSETADKINELYDRPRIHAAETPAPTLVTSQQSDVHTKLQKKLGLIVSHTSPRGSKLRTHSLRRCGNASKHCNQICCYRRIYGDDAKRCQIGRKYPKINSIVLRQTPPLQRYLSSGRKMPSSTCKQKITIFSILTHLSLLFEPSNTKI
ncbi:unnamed protein product [Hymenolepis diminuta]|uniref:Uncharacterized protein n=1 Tax=Hymenolepis diminuta TaxID=6216 RepID=A0A564Y3K8_HYMDI|nr:unnamed protein product [Hymenolepis diminuta]